MNTHICNITAYKFRFIPFCTGKNVNLMSTKDFYNAVTPGSSITHGTGLISESDYTKVTDAEIHSDALFLRCEVPVPNSILNKVKVDLIQHKMNIYLFIQISIQLL